MNTQFDLMKLCDPENEANKADIAEQVKLNSQTVKSQAAEFRKSFLKSRKERRAKEKEIEIQNKVKGS